MGHADAAGAAHISPMVEVLDKYLLKAQSLGMDTIRLSKGNVENLQIQIGLPYQYEHPPDLLGR